MSDHDAMPDPVDTAYVEAEAVLTDEAARAERRARVLAAAAREPAAVPAPPAPVRWRPAWRRDGWLAAACVAGLGLVIAIRLNPPAPRPQPAAPVATTAARTADVGPSAEPATRPPAASQIQATPAAPHRVAATVAPASPVARPAPAPVVVAAPPQAFPAGSASDAQEAAVTGSRIAPRAADAASKAASDEAFTARRAAVSEPPPPPPPPAPAPAEAAAATAPFAPSAHVALDPVARLAAAAAAGRTAEVKTLLARGVPVDTPDTEGNTALMKSIRADQPATAALLRRHGASLDHRNHAGESARDMARTAADAKLDRALGLSPEP
jgi:hypothetical protein